MFLSQLFKHKLNFVKFLSKNKKFHFAKRFKLESIFQDNFKDELEMRYYILIINVVKVHY